MLIPIPYQFCDSTTFSQCVNLIKASLIAIVNKVIRIYKFWVTNTCHKMSFCKEMNAKNVLIDSNSA